MVDVAWSWWPLYPAPRNESAALGRHRLASKRTGSHMTSRRRHLQPQRRSTRRRRLLRIFIAANCFTATLLGASHMPASASPETSPTLPIPATAPDASSKTDEVTIIGAGDSSEDTSFEALAASCSSSSFLARGDHVHRSSSGFEASGHGWWVNLSCRSASQARVTVQLQEYFTDGSWRNRGIKGDDTVYSGGGSSNRATGRAGCSTSTVTAWRSVIDVDLVGVNDPPDVAITGYQNIYCRVP